MKKKDFNPSDYDNLNNLRKKILSDITELDFNEKKILEIGSGSGKFSLLLSKRFKNSFIRGIDIVEPYIESSNSVNNSKNLEFKLQDFYGNDNTYDRIFMIFSLTELLKSKELSEILFSMSTRLLDDGYLILAEEFEDDYEEKYDLLGLKILKSLGYRYTRYSAFLKELEKSDFELIYTKLYNNKQHITSVKGSKSQIYFENKLNEFDSTKMHESSELWEKNKDEVINLGGIRTYNKTRLVVLKKKNKIIDSLNKVDNDLCQYYSISRIKNNIKYYLDLPISNLKFVFPVKTFPNKKILALFNKYNFYYDISHIQEAELVEEFKTSVFYSDPTNILKNNNSIRLNIQGTSSHFGGEYDGKQYRTYHIHLSLFKNKKIRNKILSQISKLNFSKTKYLNLGGSYDGLSYLEFYLFLLEIRKIIPKKVIILIEAGSIWFKNSGYLITKAQHINSIRNLKYVYLNSSRELHAKWSIPEYINIRKGKEQYVLCGSSCDEKDLFAHVINTNIKINDRVYFSKLEPYSYSFNHSFNGIEKAKVIIDD